ncbi:MAG: thiamine diphosphokinase [Tepidiformaceae bacterium]
MRALVFANGELPSRKLLAELRAGAELVVGADGGADAALSAGVVVDMVVGDLDSLSAAGRARLGEARVHLDADPECTDLQKAIAFCIGRGCLDVDVVAAGGGRADHALANLSVLPLFRGRARIRIIDDRFEVTLVEGTALVEGPPGTVVSLVAIGECGGVTTQGLRWDLAGERLSFSPRGVHNEIARTPATVTVEEGDLLLFRGRWVEKHG